MAASSSLQKFAPYALSLFLIVIALLFIELGTAKLFAFPLTNHPGPAVLSLLWVQGLLEVFGGFLMLIGLATRPVAFLLSGDMAVAYFIAHFPHSFFPLRNGGDAAILFCFVFLYFFFAGGGALGLDALGRKARAAASR